jgi:FAD dependent monooxygenase
MSKSHFQVIIVGGSIGGLTLAHCLRIAGIDHIVLEKSSSPAPQIGASIGILPNGARILDQLQLWSEVEDCIEPLNTATIGLPDGFSFSSSYPQIINKRFVFFNFYLLFRPWTSLTLFTGLHRFGFPIAFLDRQKLLEILYQRYPDPSKIRLKERVTAIKTSDSGATVTTANGSVYRGALVVGADGVHSIVRQEIWRASEKLSSGKMVAQQRSCESKPGAFGHFYGS